MDQTEKVLERLKSGEQWDSVLSDSGKSTAYKGVTQFFGWASPKVAELQDRLKELKTEVASWEAESSRQKAETASRAEIIAGLEERQGVAEKRCEELEAREAASQSRLERIESKLSQLDARGISMEIVEGISSTDVESPVGLLNRVKTAAESEAEEKRLAEIKQRARISHLI